MVRELARLLLTEERAEDAMLAVGAGSTRGGVQSVSRYKISWLKSFCDDPRKAGGGKLLADRGVAQGEWVVVWVIGGGMHRTREAVKGALLVDRDERDSESKRRA